jgi:hypothetical protein
VIVPGPTAAELAARRRAARHRKEAARRAEIARRAAARPTRRTASEPAVVGFAQPESSLEKAAPFGAAALGVALGVALLLFGLALIPARAVPWDRVSWILDDRREELALYGVTVLAAVGAAFALFFLAG